MNLRSSYGVMDSLTSSPIMVAQTGLCKGILRRSVRAAVSGADHAGISKHLHPHNLQIARGKTAAKFHPHSPVLELIDVLERMRFELSSVIRRDLGWSSLNIEFQCAIQANDGECVAERVESFGTSHQRAGPTVKLNDKREGGSTCTDDHSAVELETRAGGTQHEGERRSSGHGEHETTREELRAKKKVRSKGVRGEGTSEVLFPTEEQTTEDEQFMLEALREAKTAASIGEVPVGAVMVQNGRIIARAYNRVEAEADPTAHAEMLCIRRASNATGNWRLTDATMYVTMEPCPMCAGALLQSRVKRVVWGARNNLLGADGSWVKLFPDSQPAHNVDVEEADEEEGRRHAQHPFHKMVEVRREVLHNNCSMLMRSFFRSRRKGEAPAAKRKPWWLSFKIWVLLRKLMG